LPTAEFGFLLKVLQAPAVDNSEPSQTGGDGAAGFSRVFPVSMPAEHYKAGIVRNGRKIP
jgi:hypothetical protein